MSRELLKFGISKERVQPEEEDDDDRATRTAEEIKGKVGIILFCVCVGLGDTANQPPPHTKPA